MSTDMNMMLDFFIIAYGAYMVYVAFMMKKTGKIQNILISKGIDLKKAKDPEGFIRHTFGTTAAIGVICILVGAFGAYSDRSGKAGNLYLIAIAVFGISLVAYGVFMVKAQKKYLKP